MEEIVEHLVVIDPAFRAEVIEIVHEEIRVVLIALEINERRAVFGGDGAQPFFVGTARLLRDTQGFQVGGMDGHAQDQRLRAEFIQSAEHEIEVRPFVGAREILEEKFVARSFRALHERGRLPRILFHRLREFVGALEDFLPVERMWLFRALGFGAQLGDVARRLEVILHPSDPELEMAEREQRGEERAVQRGVAGEAMQHGFEQPVVLERLGILEHPAGGIALEFAAELRAQRQLRGLERGEISRVVAGIDLLREIRTRRERDRHFPPAQIAPDRGELLEHGERGGARLAHGEDAEASGVLLEKLSRRVRHFFHEFGAAVEHEQIVLRKGLLLQRDAVQLRIGKIRDERMHVPPLEMARPDEPADQRDRGEEQHARCGDEVRATGGAGFHKVESGRSRWFCNHAHPVSLAAILRWKLFFRVIPRVEML